MLPTFFVPGAGKSGTSSLHELLDQHPDVAMSRPKETQAFTLDRWAADPDARLARAWDHKPGRAVRGESSTSTLLYPPAMDRIAARIPDARFVCLLRDPVARAWSHWSWMRAQGLEWRSFRRAVEADADRPFDPGAAIAGNYRFYLAGSAYGAQVARLVARFGRKRVLVLTTESLGREPLGTVNAAFAFLDVPSLPAVVAVRANETRGAPWPPAQAAVWGATFRIRRPFARLGVPVRAALGAWRAGHPGASATPALDPADAAWLRERLADDRALLETTVARDFPEWGR